MIIQTTYWQYVLSSMKRLEVCKSGFYPKEQNNPSLSWNEKKNKFFRNLEEYFWILFDIYELANNMELDNNVSGIWGELLLIYNNGGKPVAVKSSVATGCFLSLEKYRLNLTHTISLPRAL